MSLIDWVVLVGKAIYCTMLSVTFMCMGTYLLLWCLLGLEAIDPEIATEGRRLIILWRYWINLLQVLNQYDLQLKGFDTGISEFCECLCTPWQPSSRAIHLLSSHQYTCNLRISKYAIYRVSYVKSYDALVLAFHLEQFLSINRITVSS